MISGKKKTIFFVLLLGVCLVLAGCLDLPPAGNGTGTGQAGTTQVASSSTPVASLSSGTPSKDQLVAFVTEAVAYARANGREKALSEFSNPKGTFFRGQLYIYAYDFNGTTIAHPVNPEKIGVNRLNERDAKGDRFIEELRDTAVNGSGFVQYYYVNPVHNDSIEPKLGYVMKVDDSWWLGSGIYGSLDQER
jgi:cytochrome c